MNINDGVQQRVLSPTVLIFSFGEFHILSTYMIAWDMQQIIDTMPHDAREVSMFVVPF